MEPLPKSTQVCLDFGNGTALIMTARVISVNVTGSIERVPILLQYRCRQQTWGYGLNSLPDLARALEQYRSGRATNPG
jgi:hypothetical protein